MTAPGKTIFVGVCAVAGGLQGYFWTNAAVMRQDWGSDISPLAVMLFGAFILFGAACAALAMGMLAYALSTPPSRRAVAGNAVAFLCVLGILTMGETGIPKTFHVTQWLMAIWTWYAPTVFVLIIAILTAIAKRIFKEDAQDSAG